MNYSRKFSHVLLEDIERDIEKFGFLVDFANDCREIEKLENDLLAYRAELEDWKVGHLADVSIVPESRCVNIEGIIEDLSAQLGVLYKRDNEILDVLENNKEDLEFQIVYEYLIAYDVFLDTAIEPIASKYRISKTYVQRVLTSINSFIEKRSSSILSCDSYYDSETYPALYVMNVTLSI